MTDTAATLRCRFCGREFPVASGLIDSDAAECIDCEVAHDPH